MEKGESPKGDNDAVNRDLYGLTKEKRDGQWQIANPKIGISSDRLGRTEEKVLGQDSRGIEVRFQRFSVIDPILMLRSPLKKESGKEGKTIT